MQGRVGQHDAQTPVAGRHLFGHRRVVFTRQKYDRTLNTGQQLFGRRIQFRDGRGRFKIVHHQSQRFFVAVLSTAQLRNRLVVCGVHRQVKTAQALYRHNLAGQNFFRRPVDGLLVPFELRPIPGRFVPQMRPAYRTGVGLGVESSVCGIVVFFLTGRTHGKNGHGGHGPVVRNIFDDGKARPAIGAIDKRVAVTPVGRIKQFGQTIGTNGNIR